MSCCSLHSDIIEMFELEDDLMESLCEGMARLTISDGPSPDDARLEALDGWLVLDCDRFVMQDVSFSHGNGAPGSSS
jgi:hypothetical protein